MPPRVRQNLVLLLMVVCGCVATAQDNRLMSSTEYAAFLGRLEKALPRWEERMQRVDAQKVPSVPYSVGKSVMDERHLVLLEFTYVRAWISKEHESPKVSLEFAILTSLGSIYDGFGNISALLPGEPLLAMWFGDPDS